MFYFLESFFLLMYIQGICFFNSKINQQLHWEAVVNIFLTTDKLIRPIILIFYFFFLSKSDRYKNENPHSSLCQRVIFAEISSKPEWPPQCFMSIYTDGSLSELSQLNTHKPDVHAITSFALTFRLAFSYGFSTGRMISLPFFTFIRSKDSWMLW